MLDALEDIEADRINFGLYDTFVSIDEIAARRAGGGAANPQTVRDALGRLEDHRHVLHLGDDRFRSRISEVVRVLKRVKRRFSATDADRAPYLVNAVRVEYAARRRLSRNRSLDAGLRKLFDSHRDERPRLDTARKVLSEAVAAALGQESGATQITGIQERALEQVGHALLTSTGRGFVVTGNTGSGKTEAALFPILLAALQECLTDVHGCKALLVYPRQELAKNQLQRLCRYLAFANRALRSRPGHGGATLTAGIVFGATPWNQIELCDGSADGRRRAWAPVGDGWRLPYFDAEDDSPVVFESGGDGRGRLVANGGFDAGGWDLEAFAATRNAIRERPPDFLVITTEMLHRWLNDPGANDLFGLTRPGEAKPRFHPPRSLLVDEIHLYDAAHGAQVGMLIRRLRNRLSSAMYAAGEAWKFPVVVGMSATIGAPARFWAELSGLQPHLVSPITPKDEDFEATHGREYFLFVRPETYSRGQPVGDASVAIQTLMSVAHNMRRRGPTDDAPAKHRTLVFQDSVSKIKKLAVEFHDAEVNRFLAGLRLTRPHEDVLRSPEFVDGEYWLFDASDPFQYGENRRAPGQPPAPLTTSAQPVFGERPGGDDLQRDIVLATTALEVGYDDPAIQFVLQHHAPRTPASFVQKKGRAGRSLDDRPITAVTLSRHSFRDAFYFQNPDLLYDPADYRPPLNVANFFVQRFHALALIFDELARLERRNFSRLPPQCGDVHLDARLEALRKALQTHSAAVNGAYRRVVSASFRATYADVSSVVDWLVSECADPDIRTAIQRRGDLLRGHPGLPENLFSTINLPTATVRLRPAPHADWQSRREDVALLFSEAAPGKVTRRWAWGHNLHWRAPGRLVDVERPQSGFRPEFVRTLEDEWGQEWQRVLPLRVAAVHNGRVPAAFYRVRVVELWNFGTVDPSDPKTPQPSWRWWGRREADGVGLKFSDEGAVLNDPWRRVSPDSTSDSLSFSHVRIAQRDAAEVAPAFRLQLPPLFPGLLDHLDGYCGSDTDSRSPVGVWEAHYGAEARVFLLPKSRHDPHGGPVSTTVAYTNGADGSPLLYGHDLETEGVAAAFDADVLRRGVVAVFDAWSQDAPRRNHLQDQFLRHTLKTMTWPATGAHPPLNIFDIRLAADVLSTMRAHTRADGEALRSFLDRFADESATRSLIDDVRQRYLRDGRRMTNEFVDRLATTMCDPAVRPHIARAFELMTSSEAVHDYLAATAVHSLKHAVARLFSTEGYARDEEVGSTVSLPFTHGHWGDDDRFYVFERNAGGNGATRLLAEVASRPTGYLLSRWWDHALGCPVGQEEDFVRASFETAGDNLVAFAKTFLAAEPGDRPLPREALKGLLPDVLADDVALGRLAGIVTGELNLAGEPGIATALLHHELQGLERELAERFQRHPAPDELAGHVATQVETEPARWPGLAALLALYQRHADELGQAGDPATTAVERFLDQVGHLLPRTCVDACPACLGGNCHIGSIDATRHALSRRLLRALHDFLTDAMTVLYESGTTRVDDLLTVAAANAGSVILVCDRPLASDFAAAMRDRFDERARIPDHQNSTLRLMLEIRPVA